MQKDNSNMKNNIEKDTKDIIQSKDTSDLKKLADELLNDGNYRNDNNFEKAEAVLTTLAARDDIESIRRLSDIYFYGFYERNKDWKKSGEIAGLGASLNDAVSLYRVFQVNFDIELARRVKKNLYDDTDDKLGFGYYCLEKSAELGYLKACYALGMLHSNSDTLYYDIEKSKSWYRKIILEADCRYKRITTNAFINLQKIYIYEKGIKTGEREKGKLLFTDGLNLFKSGNKTQARDKFIESIQYGVFESLDYLIRDDVAKDYDEKLMFAKMGRDFGRILCINWYCDYIMKRDNLHQSMYIEAVKYKALAANHGNFQACMNLAYTFMNAYRVFKSIDYAKYFVKIARPDRSCASAYKSLCLRLENEINAEKYISHYKDNAKTAIAREFRKGLVLRDEGNYTEAIKKFENIAKMHHIPSIAEIGFCYYYGRGVELNYEKAYKFIETAAYYGDVYARNFLKGNFTGVCPSSWILYFKNTGEHGAIDLFTNHMKRYKSEKPFASGPKEAMIIAVDNYKQSLRNINDTGHDKYLHSGKFVKSNLNVSYDYFAKAALYGDQDALCILGMFEETKRHYKTQGGISKAIQYYRLAAMNGHPYAMYRVAQYYDDINRNISNECYRIAAEWNNRASKVVCDDRGIKYR